MFNTLAQYFLGTSSNSNNLDPGSKTNNHHQEVPTNDHQPSHQHHRQNVDQALAQQNVFQVYPNKRGRARRNRKNKATQKGQQQQQRTQGTNNCQLTSGSAVEDLLEECPGAADFLLLNGITTRICEDEDEWLFVECAAQQKAAAGKKGGLILLHDDDDDLLGADVACLSADGSGAEVLQVFEPPKPRFEIKHNPLNLNQQQLKRQLRQHNAALISCEDIADDEELKRSGNNERGSGASSGEGAQREAEDIQVIGPEQSAVVEGNSVDVEVPPVAGARPAESGAPQQQRQAHGDEEPSDLCQAAANKASPSAPVQIKQAKQRQGMDESWFVTPPSCFTSQGPVHMEMSPMENLLIEHPSMSVYHGVRSMERSADIEESLVVLEKEQQQQRDGERDMEVKMDQQQDEEEEEAATAPAAAPTPVNVTGATTTPTERTPVHNHDKKMRQKLCRNAMTRSNKTCEMNATKNGPKKRSEKQHAKSQSRANNNRKC